MHTNLTNSKAILMVLGSHEEFRCEVVSSAPTHARLEPEDGSFPTDLIKPGLPALLIWNRHNHRVAKSTKIKAASDTAIDLQFSRHGKLAPVDRDVSLTDCQLPAMYRPSNGPGYYGCWRGALITKHGPDVLHLRIDDGGTVPDHMELMFSPIGSDSGGGARMYADDGSVVNASDVRSRRIRVQALTESLLASETPGTIQLIVRITRTLYRTA
ncbi:MAG: hypothetical protein IH944_08495 [Armatimonadetes bacterium]|nr:hypothetical protein [Armatimonadota bacterium]